MYFGSYKTILRNTFYKTRTNKLQPKDSAEIKDFLNAIGVSKLSEHKLKLCEEDL